MDGEVSLGNAIIWWMLAVTGIFLDVIATQHAAPRKVVSESMVFRGMGKPEKASRGAPDRLESL